MSAAKRTKLQDYSFLPNNVQAIAIKNASPDALTTTTNRISTLTNNAIYCGQLQTPKLDQIIREKHNNIRFASLQSQQNTLIYAVAHPTLCSQRHLAAILKKLTNPDEKSNPSRSKTSNSTIDWTSELIYWEKRLENVQLELDLSLHFDKSSPGGAGESNFRLCATKIRHFCTKFEVKPSVFFFSTFQALLYKYSHQKVFSIRTFVDNFDNCVCVPCVVSGERTFLDLVRQTRSDFDTFSTFSSVPFQLIESEILLNRKNNILFNFSDKFRQTPDKFDVSYHNCDTNAMLVLNIDEKPNEFNATLNYDDKLFCRHKIDKLATHFRSLLDDCIENSDKKLSNYSLLTSQDENLLEKWNETQQEVDFELSIPRMFDDQVERCGTKMAVMCDDKFVTYAQLDRRINLLVTYFSHLGVESSVVGVCMEKCIDLVATFVAILKTGSSYVAIDPSFPAERIKYLVENSDVKFVITNAELVPKFPQTISVILVEDFDSELRKHQPSGRHYHVTSCAPAYVIYTSGTTGKPKGVVTTHRNVVCLVNGMISVFKSRDSKGILLHASPSFCVFHGLLYYALAVGRAAILAPSLLHLPEIKFKEQISFIATPPAGFRQLMTDRSLPRSLKIVVLGGDVIPGNLVAELQENRPEVQIFISHGCTEVTLFATCGLVPQNRPPNVSAGAPVSQKLSAEAPVPQNGPLKLSAETLLPRSGPPKKSARAPVPQNEPSEAPDRSLMPQKVSPGAMVPQDGPQRVSAVAPVPQVPKSAGALEPQSGPQKKLTGAPVLQNWTSEMSQKISAGAPVPQNGSLKLNAGGPMPNMKAYVVDEDLRKVPIGFVGELCLSGPQVVEGYLNLKSRDAFVNNPFDFNGFYAKMYRTGDLARWTDDGRIEIVGRINSMVKINGIRIELDEIANVLFRHDAILEAVVSVAPINNSRLLVAYCVTKPIESFDAIKEYLMSSLPYYMVPQMYVKMEKLPRNMNGKIDRHLLPPPPSGGGKDNQIQPRSETEIQILAVVRRLMTKPVSLGDNLLENGLDSILATQLVIELEKIFKIKIPVSVVYDGKDSVALCRHIDYTLRGAAVQISRDLIKEAILSDDVTADAAHGVDFTNAVNPNYILLTGATGFVGAFILAELLTTTKAYIYCLVRAKNPIEGNLRVRQNLDFYKLWRSEYESKLSVLPGDVTQPNLGLSPQEYETMTSIVDIIYHSAATVNFLLPYSAIKNGVDEILKFAMAVKIKPFHYISSIAVHGNKNKCFSPSRAFEDADLNDSVDLIPQNGYAQTKWVSEKIVRLAAARGLPVTIFRPSYVSGHSATGSIGIHEFVARLIKDCVRAKCYPNVDLPLQLVPVDYVSRSVVKISLDANCFGKVFHLTPSWTNDVTIRELMECVGRCGYELAGIECGKWLEMLTANSDGDWALYPLLDFVSGYLSASATDFWEFDATNVENVLGHAQMEAAVDFNCVKAMVDFLIECKFLTENC